MPRNGHDLLPGSREDFKVKDPRNDKGHHHAGKQEIHKAAAMPKCSGLHEDKRNCWC